MRHRTAIIFCSLLILASCRKSTPDALFQGPQTLTGVLLPTEISLLRRGTHLLKIDGEVLYYVESAKVNLKAYEGRKIGLRGVIQPNIDSSYEPVFVVEDVLLGSPVAFKEVALPSLEVRLSVPSTWQAEALGTSVRFTETGSTAPLLLILEQHRGELPFDFDRPKQEPGITMTQLWIGSSRAVRVSQAESRNQAAFVERDEPMPSSATGSMADARILSFAFTPGSEGEFAEQDALFTAILRSIRFERKASLSSAAKLKSVQGGSASSNAGPVEAAEGKPCGGPAGILCPSGYYCQVTDWETSIGKCKKL